MKIEKNAIRPIFPYPRSYIFTLKKGNISPDTILVNKFYRFDKRIKKYFCANIISTKNIFEKYQKKIIFKKKINKILIYGDVLKKNSLMLLNLLDQIQVSKSYSFDFKPHPSTPLSFENFKNLKIKETTRVLNKYDKVLTVGGTGAIYEAAQISNKIGVFVPFGDIDFSPNIHQKGILKVNSKLSLIKFLKK